MDIVKSLNIKLKKNETVGVLIAYFQTWLEQLAEDLLKQIYPSQGWASGSGSFERNSFLLEMEVRKTHGLYLALCNGLAK